MDEWIKKGAYGSRWMALAVNDGVASCRRRQGFDESRAEEAEDTASEKSDECINICTIILLCSSSLPHFYCRGGKSHSTAHYHHSRNAGKLANGEKTFSYSISHLVRPPGSVPQRVSCRVRGQSRTDWRGHGEGELSQINEDGAERCEQLCCQNMSWLDQRLRKTES